MTSRLEKTIIEHLDVDVFPHTCYVASDKVRPRWRFLVGLKNRSLHSLKLKALHLVQYADRQQQTTSYSATLPQLFVQGNADLESGLCALLDVQEPLDTIITAQNIVVRLFLQQRQACITISKHIHLVPRKTRYLRFPMNGTWLVANGRPDLHCVGIQFGFDFIHPKEMKFHDYPPTRQMSLDEFPSYAKDIHAPVSGLVVQAVGDQPDFQPTLTHTTFPDVPPAENPKAVIGNYIVLRMDTGEFVLMAHFQQGSVHLKPGQLVLEGETIGKLGNSGNTSGPHLHIELLDCEPDWSRLCTRQFQGSGIPFGFHIYRNRINNKRIGLARIVPRKKEIISHDC